MPELPEVETTRLGITPAILGQRVSGVEIRQPVLRWRVPDDLARHIVGKSINRVERRGKYLLLQAGTGWVIVHLGMSGSLRVLPSDAPASLHDHVDIVFGQQLLRLRDPRRFGAVLWQEGDAQQHSLLASLGPEPLSEAFTTEHLYQQTRGRRAAIKLVLMDHHMVVGVGNIYASESLFRAGIRPGTAAHRLSRARCARLVQAVKDTLRAALAAGGSTLRNFVGSDGAPGYFLFALRAPVSARPTTAVNVRNNPGSEMTRKRAAIRDKSETVHPDIPNTTHNIGDENSSNC
jgi:formamidopyrimidine-DNA glycosylase